MPRVTLKFANAEMGTFEVLDQQPVVVGRAPDCTVVIDNPGVSRRHCQIEKRGAICIVSDLNSNNGTFHNGRKVQQANLNNGDEIAVGKHVLVYLDENAGPVAPLPGLPGAPAAGEAGFGPNTMMIDMNRQVTTSRDRRGHLTVKMQGKEQTIMLRKPDYIIGSSPACDIVVKGWRVSKKHVVIVKDEHGFRIIDVSDKKPTLVNNSPVDRAILKKGDVIRVGGSEFNFYQED
jgi:pSer/pThr/pTyr-binding forkhead associated (FHA) protein